MTEYRLYLESGPMHRKTMVHVLDLLGCMANGLTTEAALEATPEAIAKYRRFLKRCGERVDTDAPISTRVEEHSTEGTWLGNGDPGIAFGPDLLPVPSDEVEIFLNRSHRLRQELVTWAQTRPEPELAVKPQQGRAAGAILRHVLDTPGAYLSAALGGFAGYGRIAGAVDRGDLPVVEGLMQIYELAAARLRATTEEERTRIVERKPGDIRTLRKAIRRMLEHDWEHLAELSRRPGGPKL